jgi:hypothetical protein
VGKFAKSYDTLLQDGGVAAEEYYCHYFYFSNIRKKWFAVYRGHSCDAQGSEDKYPYSHKISLIKSTLLSL